MRPASAVYALLLLPQVSWSLVAIHEIKCEIPNPCEQEPRWNRKNCADEKAEWIIDGTFRFVGGSPVMERISVVRGGTPLHLDANGVEYYRWVSCWKKLGDTIGPMRAYGMNEGGVFLVYPSNETDSPPLQRHRPSVP